MLYFKGKVISVIKKKRRLPNGHVAHLEIVEHPGAVLIVPFLNHKKVIFIRQFRPVIGSYLYELPAGTLSKNEKPLEAAQREIIEETGFQAKRFSRLGKIFPVPGYSTEVITIYKAERLEKRQGRADKDEIITPYILTRSQIKNLFNHGKIKDAKTICALAFCGWI